MKKLLVLFFLFSSLVTFAQQKKVAIYVVGNDDINSIISDHLMDRIANDGKYIVVERTASFLRELLKEQSYQYSGAVDDNELVRLGEQFGVDYVCVAKANNIWGHKYISVRMIDVERAEVIATASAYGEVQTSNLALVSTLNKLSTDLIYSFEASKNPNAKKVAVYVPRMGSGDIDLILGDQMVAGFAASGRYLAIERTQAFLDELNKEYVYQQTGMVDDADLMRLGKHFGVQYVSVIKTSMRLGEYFIAARLLDVERGDVVNSCKKEAIPLQSIADVVAVAEEIASELSGSVIAEKNTITHEYVDLGLSVKWATCNVGAAKPEDYGDYFAWGETEPKSTYDWSTYKWCYGSYNTQTKYCTSSEDGSIDNRRILDISDDAARVNWGGSWRMPTQAEQKELQENCSWTWVCQNGVYGYRVTSKKPGYTHKSIFLPAAGCRIDSSPGSAGSVGTYWSSSLLTDEPSCAYELDFLSDEVYRSYDSRYCGQSVRPVMDTEGAEYVDLGLPSGTLWKNANEGDNDAHYTYDEAISRFGNKLPTKQQLEELKNKCTWTWTGSGYKVIGPNGNSIYLPAAGDRDCYDGVNYVGTKGGYWSSTLYDSDYPWYLGFGSSKVYLSYCHRCVGQSVRLVQNL